MSASRIKPLCGPFAWTAAELDQNSGWSVVLHADELACLDSALDVVMSRQIAWSSLTKSQFPLPELSQRRAAKFVFQFGLTRQQYLDNLLFGGLKVR